ncbi:MAG TPA: DUF3443 domain-containing protein [Terriglobia bacterium]|nr:DUF3443 domain-containing protein [Terriglobia bacterium]
MRLQPGWQVRLALVSLIPVIALALAGCGGSSPGSDSGSGSNPPPPSVNNNQPIEVNLGPLSDYPNGLFTTVTICVPGTSNCQNIPDVLVDTGSEGLRLLSSAVTLQLPTIADGSNNDLQECVVYGDGSFNWGGVVSADIKLAGEIGSSVPMQLIDSKNPTTFPVPNDCLSGGGSNSNTVQALGANGILGVGNYRQDCGSNCANSAVPGTYYLCPGSSCTPATVPVDFQVQNPVWTFPQDNNGLLISLPTVPDTGAPTASGSLIFGIGTQDNNGIGTAVIYALDQSGDITTAFNGVSYNSFIDSGSNGLFFLDAATLGIIDCADNPSWYCPGVTQSYTVTNSSQNGTSGTVTFNIANADALFLANGGQNAAFNNLGGGTGTDPSTDYVDFGMPFFYGRDVFVGIENQTGPGGVVGPYWAY